METTYTKKTIRYELAARMVDAAIARATQLGARQNVAVLDEGGNLKAFGRMDGAPILGIEGCQRKAFTALYGLSTEALYQRIKDDPSRLIGLSHFSRRPWWAAACRSGWTVSSSAASEWEAAPSSRTSPARRRGSTC